MAIYTIGEHNIITMHAGEPANGTAGARFDSPRDLAKATAEWPVSRLAEVWNKLPLDGLKPVKQLMDRKTAVARVWAAIQNLPRIPAPGVATGAKAAAKIRGVIGKQLGLKVESTRTDTGERRYRIMA
jgi:hypothetical protein